MNLTTAPMLVTVTDPSGAKQKLSVPDLDTAIGLMAATPYEKRVVIRTVTGNKHVLTRRFERSELTSVSVYVPEPAYASMLSLRIQRAIDEHIAANCTEADRDLTVEEQQDMARLVDRARREIDPNNEGEA